MKPNPTSGIAKYSGDSLTPPGQVPFSADLIPDGGIGSRMLTDVPAELITSGHLRTTTDIDTGNLHIHGYYGIYGGDVEGYPSFLLSPNGSGYFGNGGMSWTVDGTLTVRAANVLGELVAASIKADAIVAGNLLADIAMFGNLRAGTTTEEMVELGVAGLKLYNSQHTVTGHLKTDGTGWLGKEDEFAWNDNGVLIWRLTTGYLQSDVSPNPRIVIDHDEIAGYSDATTKQFYLLASDGKGYFAGGNAVLDASGLAINYPTGSTAAYLTLKYNSKLHGYVAAGVRGAIPSLNITGKNNGDDDETEVLIQAFNGKTPVGSMQPYIRLHGDGSSALDYAGILLYCEDKTNGGIASIEMKSLYDDPGSIVLTADTITLTGDVSAPSLAPVVAYGSSTTNYVPSSGTGDAYEVDTTLDVTITPAVTSTLVVMLTARVFSDTVRAGSWRLRLLLNDTTSAGGTEQQGSQVAGSSVIGTVLAVFTGVAAGTHKLEMEVARVNTADTVTVGERKIVVVAYPE